MSVVIPFDLKLGLVAVEMSCGHQVFVTQRFDTQRRKAHDNFYCTCCGIANWYLPPKIVTPPPPAKKSVGEKIVRLLGSASSDETNSASVSSKSALDRGGEHGK